jgi:20S proteasome alpha/beta subunit
MNVKQGVELAVKAINSSLARDSATGEGIVVFTITKEGIKNVFDKDIKSTA